MDELTLFVPPYLQAKGYCEYQEIIDFANKCFEPGEGKWNLSWVEWHGFLQYLSYIEFGSEQALNTKVKLSSNTERNYYVISLIYFSKALFDIISEWLKDKYALSVENAQITLSNNYFQKQIIAKDVKYKEFFNKHKKFLDIVEKYRKQWIHIISGGGMFVGRGSKDGGFNVKDMEFLIPRNPKTSFTKLENDGTISNLDIEEGFYSLEEFVKFLTENVRRIVLDLMKITVSII